jgi:hypothetical protein
VDDVLNSLGRMDARRSQVVKLRFFGALNFEETAGAEHLCSDGDARLESRQGVADARDRKSESGGLSRRPQ